jgi:hypothetical protein
MNFNHDTLPGTKVEVFSFGRWYAGTLDRMGKTRVWVTYTTGTGATRTKAFPAAKVRPASGVPCLCGGCSAERGEAES